MKLPNITGAATRLPLDQDCALHVARPIRSCFGRVSRLVPERGPLADRRYRLGATWSLVSSHAPNEIWIARQDYESGISLYRVCHRYDGSGTTVRVAPRVGRRFTTFQAAYRAARRVLWFYNNQEAISRLRAQHFKRRATTPAAVLDNIYTRALVSGFGAEIRAISREEFYA